MYKSACNCLGRVADANTYENETMLPPQQTINSLANYEINGAAGADAVSFRQKRFPTNDTRALNLLHVSGK